MANPERSHEPLATFGQIQRIYGNIGAQTLVNGTRGENSHRLDLPVTVLPTEVAAHMPPLEDESRHVEYGVHLEEHQHSLLAKPESPEDISVVRFSRTEHVSTDQGFITDVSYCVTQSKDGVGLERRVDAQTTESRARKGLQEMGRSMRIRLEAIEPSARIAREAKEVVESAKLRMGLEQERALGFSNVAATEAEQVARFLESIPSEQP